jgi:hypothetical protein
MSGTLCRWNFKLIYNVNLIVSRRKDLKCTVSNGCLAFRSPAIKDLCLKDRTVHSCRYEDFISNRDIIDMFLS